MRDAGLATACYVLGIVGNKGIYYIRIISQG